MKLTQGNRPQDTSMCADCFPEIFTVDSQRDRKLQETIWNGKSRSVGFDIIEIVSLGAIDTICYAHEVGPQQFDNFVGERMVAKTKSTGDSIH